MALSVFLSNRLWPGICVFRMVKMTYYLHYVAMPGICVFTAIVIQTRRTRQFYLPVFVVVLVSFGVPNLDDYGPHAYAYRHVRYKLQRVARMASAYRNEHPEIGFPKSMPNLPAEHFADDYFTFSYLPKIGTDGKVIDYEITAAACNIPCGLSGSYVQASDGEFRARR